MFTQRPADMGRSSLEKKKHPYASEPCEQNFHGSFTQRPIWAPIEVEKKKVMLKGL